MRLKKLVAVFFLLALPLEVMAKTDLPYILGFWKYEKLIYRGQEMNPVDPLLDMRISFHEIGLGKLHYRRNGEEGFCERSAIWYYNPKTRLLYQRVVSLNSGNRFDCEQDTDMRMNQETWSPVSVNGDFLYLTVPLSDEFITLVWRREKGPF